MAVVAIPYWDYFPRDYYFEEWTSLALFFVVSSYLTLAVTAVFLALRLYTRIGLSHFFGYDDVFCILAFLAAVVHAAVSVDLVKRGLGRPGQDFPNGFFFVQTSFGKYWLILLSAYMIGICFMKLSIVGLYLRTIAKTKPFRWTCYVLEFLIAGAHFSVLVRTLSICRPIQASWRWQEGAECGDDEIEVITLSVVVLATDIVMLIIPTPTIWKLRLPRRERIAIILMFHAGLIATLIAAVRMGLSIYDLYWNDNGGIPHAQLAITGQFELTVGIICSCLPTLKAFFSKHLPRVLQSYADRSRNAAHSSTNDRSQFSRADAPRGLRAMLSHNNSSQPKDEELMTLKAPDEVYVTPR